jgi:hypothetical protein
MFRGFILLVWFETRIFSVLRFQSTQKKHHGSFLFLNCVSNLDSHNTHLCVDFSYVILLVLIMLGVDLIA